MLNKSSECIFFVDFITNRSEKIYIYTQKWYNITIIEI